MVQQFLNRQSSLYDTGSIYGWISILLHWVTAILVTSLWFLGQSIMNVPADEMDDRRALHVSIAAAAWLLLVFRAFWRYRSGHPYVRGQSAFIHRIAVVAHYTMLIIMLLMLVSGPIMVWAAGRPIVVFDTFAVPSLTGESESLGDFAWFVHSNSAMALFWLIVLHIAGAFKHLMFHSDDTIARMIWPGKPSGDSVES